MRTLRFDFCMDGKREQKTRDKSAQTRVKMVI